MTGQWIRADWDFGPPSMVLWESLRKIMTTHPELSHAMKGDDPNKVADAARRIIEWTRPELKGVVVVGLNLRYGMSVEFWVVHPSFKPVALGNDPPRQYLEKCYVCHEPLVNNKDGFTSFCLVNVNGAQWTVCSEKCATEAKHINDDPLLTDPIVR